MQVSEPYPCHGGNFASLFLRVGLLNFSTEKSQITYLCIFFRRPQTIDAKQSTNRTVEKLPFLFWFFTAKKQEMSEELQKMDVFELSKQTFACKMLSMGHWESW